MEEKPVTLLRRLSGLFMVSLVVVFSLSLLNGCSKDTSAYDPYTAYLQACIDASNISPDKISKSLTAITPENTNLVWENGVVGVARFGRQLGGSKCL